MAMQPAAALPEGVTVRPVMDDDLEPTYDLFLAAANDLRARSGRTPVADTAARRERAIAFRRHALTHDGAGSWIAEAEGQRVGFGIATMRGNVWYLAALHVLPAWQGRGVGRALLRQCLLSAGDDAIRTTVAEASQPVSNALYAKHGLWQWVPLVTLEGAPFASDLRFISVDQITATDEALAALRMIDAPVVGVDRTIDHQFWLSLPGVTGLLVSRGNQPLGYGYLSMGAIGPVAARAPSDLTTTLRACIGRAHDAGRERIVCRLPGLCRRGLALLVDAGFHYDADIDLILASQPFGQLDRYLISVGDALI